MIKILITGAGGQLASSFKSISHKYTKYEFNFLNEEEFNLLDYENIKKHLAKNKYDVIINCAAYTNVDQSEDTPGAAIDANVKGVKFLVKEAVKNNAFIIHFSTDYIFDGYSIKPYKEDDIAKPLNTYGVTKLKSERILKRNKANACIFRTSWLFSPFGHNFVKTILQLCKQKDSIDVINDQIGCPTYAIDLAEHILYLLPKLIELNGVNIFHYANSGFATWYDFALKIKQIAELNCKIMPISSHKLHSPAYRPKYSILDTSKIISTFNISIPKWQNSLENCIELLKDGK